MHYRFATPEDAVILASLNQQLIRAEGHRNPMSVEQLTDRMSAWLNGEYQAVILEEATAAVGYALFRKDLEHVYLRQLFVVAERRRQGVGREAIGWLWRNAWNGVPRLRIEVLVGNVSGRKFWRSVGFEEYCVTMEATPPNDG
jgi:GNAT superfamily N-acetyltransferase